MHRRIETVFLERNDLAGQVAFYTERCRRRPDDLTSALQLAAALMRSGKVDEAIARYRTTIAVAPTRRDLREALIESLERAERPATPWRSAARLPSGCQMIRISGSDSAS